MGHSDKCKDLTTRLERFTGQCVPCMTKPGYEVTPNCGYDDNGGLHEPPIRKCRDNTYNDGSRALCLPCSVCPPGHDLISVCNATTDTRCRETRRSQTSAVPVTTISTGQDATSTGQGTLRTEQNSNVADLKWQVPIILISILLVHLSACIIYRKWTKGRRRLLCYRRKSLVIREGFSSLSTPDCTYDLEAILSPIIQSAPLQTVLDNLDVLEELVILLDPDSQKVKNTRHLASHWSFPSTWINYIYSMKDNKSPLKAVLEAVISRHPDWTVAHLAVLLGKMERNDAIAVLAQLQNEIQL